VIAALVHRQHIGQGVEPAFVVVDGRTSDPALGYRVGVMPDIEDGGLALIGLGALAALRTQMGGDRHV